MKKKIAILEDDEDTQDLIGFILVDDFYELTMCSTVSALTKELKNSLPHLIIMDINLPDGSGTELCKKLKNDQATSYIPILLMSALEEGFLLESGANSFIGKPFNIDTFKSIVEGFL